MSNKINLIDVKRLILKRFPFDIIVLERPTKKTIIAVAHHAKNLGIGGVVLRPNAANRDRFKI
jgi:hypothetical protein